MRTAAAFVLFMAIAASAAPAHADRSRLFPTLGAGVVWTSGDEDPDALIWAGVLARPTRGSGAFWGATLEADIGDGAASLMPTARAGAGYFADPDDSLPIASVYLIGGAGLRDIDGEATLVVRGGLGFQLLPLLALADAGLVCPDVFELVADVGYSDAVTSLRLSWGL
jgi:hypothetical protein